MDALDTLLRHDGAALLTTARCWLGTRRSALDAVAEGVSAIASGARSQMTRAQLRRAVVTAAIRRLATEVEAGEEAVTDLLPAYDDSGKRLPDPHADPDAIRRHGPVGAELIRASLVQVPVPFRQAVLLVDVEGWTAADAAATLGVPTTVLKRRLHLARMALMSLVQRASHAAHQAA